MKTNCIYRFYYNLHDVYIEGELIGETNEYYTLKSPRRHINAGGYNNVDSCNDQCIVLKSQIIYITKQS